MVIPSFAMERLKPLKGKRQTGSERVRQTQKVRQKEWMLNVRLRVK